MKWDEDAIRRAIAAIEPELDRQYQEGRDAASYVAGRFGDTLRVDGVIELRPLVEAILRAAAGEAPTRGD